MIADNSLKSDLKIKIASEKSFGVVFSILFLIIAILPLFSEQQIRYWALILSTIFLSITLIKADVLKPLNLLWAKFGIFLAWVINPIILACLFYVFITPYGLILRLFQVFGVKLKTAPHTKTYWTPSENHNPKTDLLNQF